VAGFVALQLEKAVYPAEHLQPLRRMGYSIDIDTVRCRHDHDSLFRELHQTLASRRQALDYFWDAEKWSYLELVVTGTDRLQHYLWSALEDEAHPYHDAALGYYGAVDALIGELFDRFRKVGPEENFLLISDHGFTGITREVYLNRWLQEAGFAEFQEQPPSSFTQIADASPAFALDPGRIYIHRRDRFARGSVEPADVAELKKQIAEKLLALRCDGEPVVERVFDAEELYSGPCTARGPDLVVLSHRGFDIKGAIKKVEVFGRSDLQGMHTWDDAILWTTGDAPDEPHITDLAPLILDRLRSA
jgi:predicted AlkP superfamily phosphohydrolase/phosphomutase